MLNRRLVRLLRFFRNPFLKLLILSAIYTAWVLWMDTLWLLVGLIIIADLVLTRFINWRFWRKRLPKGKKHKLKTELIDSAIIAVLVVAFIRVFLFEAYTIPTSSMEKTLLVGDYYLVNKMRYGPRLPMTPITIPFTHNTMPFFNERSSFSSRVQLPYRRLPGFKKIKRNDVIVFNYPEGDTIIASMPEKSYYTMTRQYGVSYIKNNYKIIYRPVDKRDNYVKRVIGLPGDTIKIMHGNAYANQLAEKSPAGLQFNYSVKTNHIEEDSSRIVKLGVAWYDVAPNEYNGIYEIPLTRGMYRKILDSSYFGAISRYENIDPTDASLKIFPFNERFTWTEDNFGPIAIPYKGLEIVLNKEELPLYYRIITAYEGNTIDVRNNLIYINNYVTRTYTFKMNYYFVMGDNRHNSNDSRYWGFVPEDHIIGKASLVWLSLDKEKKFPDNIRWDKMFKFIR